MDPPPETQGGHPRGIKRDADAAGQTRPHDDLAETRIPFPGVEVRRFHRVGEPLGQMCDMEGGFLGKPVEGEQAEQQAASGQGRPHGGDALEGERAQPFPRRIVHAEYGRGVS